MAVNVNPNIIMGFRGPQINNPLAVAAQAESVKSARMQNALAQAQIDAMNSPEAQQKKALEKKKVMFGYAKEVSKFAKNAAEYNAAMQGQFGDDANDVLARDDSHYSEMQLNLNPQKGRVSQARGVLIQEEGRQIFADPYTGEAIKEYGAKPATKIIDKDAEARKAELERLRIEREKGAIDAQKNVKPTEDQSKALGWLQQARFSKQNMDSVLLEDPNAATPTMGEIVGTSLLPKSMEALAYDDKRQRFNNAASQFAEAVLRAATGAGITEHEANQKIKELTPVYGESQESIKQKLQAQNMYLDSLEARVGPAIKNLPQQGKGMPQQSTGKQLSPQDQQALDWANANPNDQRAITIKQRLGM